MGVLQAPRQIRRDAHHQRRLELAALLQQRRQRAALAQLADEVAALGVGAPGMHVHDVIVGDRLERAGRRAEALERRGARRGGELDDVHPHALGAAALARGEGLVAADEGALLELRSELVAADHLAHRAELYQELQLSRQRTRTVTRSGRRTLSR